MSHFSWSQRATKDLQKIAGYIRAYSAAKAYETTALLIASADQLRVQPHAGQKCETLPDGSALRPLLVKRKYRLVYKVPPNDDVEILQVIDVQSDQDFTVNVMLVEAARPPIHGVGVNARTQCAHYHSERDIIAIKHKCCDTFYACIRCHNELADHAPVVWPKDERDAAAILCGNCHSILQIADYLACANTCPACQAAFNPGCANHYPLYFEM